MFRRVVGALRRHFHGRCDLWAAGSGTLRPLDDQRPRLPSWSGQVWLREHALAPWLVDVLLNPGGPRTWVFKRDRSVTRALADATWVAADMLLYLRPELVLAHKLRLSRPVDDVDLDAVLPLLEPSADTWLRDHVATAAPGHRWNLALARRRKPRPSS